MFHLFLVNDNYYYFFRLHQLLCERLLKMFQQSLRLIEQDSRESKDSGSHRHRPSPSAAAAFRGSNRCKCRTPNDGHHETTRTPLFQQLYQWKNTTQRFSTWFVICSTEIWTVQPTKIHYAKCSAFTPTSPSPWTKSSTTVFDRYSERERRKISPVSILR